MSADIVRFRSNTAAFRLPSRIGTLVFLVDGLAILSAFLLATYITSLFRFSFFNEAWGDFYDGVLPHRGLQVYVLATALCTWLYLHGHYSARHSFTSEAKQILIAVLAITAIDGYFQFALKAEPSRLWLTSTWLLSGVLIMAGRVALKRTLFQRGYWRCPTVVIGTGRGADDIVAALDGDSYLGHVITRRIVTNDQAIAQVEQAVQAGECSYILVAFDETNVRETMEIVRHVDEHLSVPHGIVPVLREISLGDLELHKFFGHDLLVLTNRRRSQAASRQRYKRLFDIVGTSLILLLLMPLMLLVAFLVRLDGGPALYGSPRIGRNGQVFKALKFRSMVPNAGDVLRDLLASDPAVRREWEENFKLRNDPRITRIGQFIRRTSIDELPQLFNVLKGDMSLVGPRPHATMMRVGDKYYFDAVKGYTARHRVKPGITGLAQVRGLRGEIATTERARKRVEYDVYYIENWSPLLDIRIMIETVLKLIWDKNAY